MWRGHTKQDLCTKLLKRTRHGYELKELKECQLSPVDSAVQLQIGSCQTLLTCTRHRELRSKRRKANASSATAILKACHKSAIPHHTTTALTANRPHNLSCKGMMQSWNLITAHRSPPTQSSGLLNIKTASHPCTARTSFSVNLCSTCNVHT